MASSKMVLMLAVLAVASLINAESSSSSNQPRGKKAIEKNARTMYHLLEGKKNKQHSTAYNYNHAPDEGMNKDDYAHKNYDQKPKTEGFRHVTVIPNYNNPYLPDPRETPYSYTPLTTTSTPTTRKPSRCPCKSTYKTLSTTTMNKLIVGPPHDDFEHVTQPTSYHEHTQRKAHEKKESKKKMSCGDRKLRKIKHFIIRKNESPRENKYMDEETSVEKY